MLKIIDNFLDKITMYRLVLYELIGLLLAAFIYSLFHVLPFSPWAILFSTGIILVVSLLTNIIFSWIFKAPTNIESVYITALILALIITPSLSMQSVSFFLWAGLLSMASKYLFAIGKKHLFNPVAIAVVLTAFVLSQSASWWVGTTAMMPFVLVFGLLIVKKIQREDMVFTFFSVALATELVFTMLRGGSFYNSIQTIIFHSSLLFFGFVMFTEPLTTPPTKKLQIIYAMIVGFLFDPRIHVGNMYSTPELALIVGNIYSYVVSPKEKLVLRVAQVQQYATDILDFIFPMKQKMAYTPGQYMEWTLPHKNTDSRGNRRYFTLASSPTESTLRLGVKFYAKGSSFKRSLSKLSDQTPIMAGQLAGNFTLPEDKNKKLVFIAGGIGITPFRSMIKYCIDKKEVRPIILLYANKLFSEIAYADVFEDARNIGIQTFYTLTDTSSIPTNWQGGRGRLTAEMIAQMIPDFIERTFYLSGPQTMVTAYEEILKSMKIPFTQIKKDFFPGFV